ncbi:unnamed protein product [Bursaphelenchus okinawaensis]|uniref:Uncharacterized protein n=1 Tax=Bursaphelenchus okinawaensis TaxID=465554 RepID=A0A811KNC7_9BILA|nr:unnamed protein product [Bursaphelenchus okinawaensis]CAG9108274.1 unnamed protein product [Bursaphelenchus okinawaensis]
MYPLLVAFVVPALLVALLGLLTCLHRNNTHIPSSSSRPSWFWANNQQSQYILIPSSQPPSQTHHFEDLPRYQDLQLPAINKLKSDPLTKTWSV